MAERINAYCKICNSGYHMCLSCKDTMKLAPWKTDTDTPEHYKIYQILSGYNLGKYTKEEAKERFKNVDLSDIDTFKDGIKNKIFEIVKEENKEIVQIQNIEETENKTLKEVEEKIPEENVISKKSSYVNTKTSSKKKYVKSVETE